MPRSPDSTHTRGTTAHQDRLHRRGHGGCVHFRQRRRLHVLDRPGRLSPYLIEANALPDELHGTDPTDH